MSRYFTRPAAQKPRADDWYDESLVLNNLSVPEHVAADTGLLDHRGDTIMRAPNPVGFVWEGER